MSQKRIQELQSITARLGQLDVSTLSESQLAERNTLIKNIKEELTKIKEVSDRTLKDYRQAAHTEIQGAKFGKGKGTPEAEKTIAKREKGMSAAAERQQARSDAARAKYKPPEQAKGASGPQDWYGQNRYMGDSVEYDMVEDKNDEYNDEAGMAKSNLHTMSRAVAGLIKTIEDNDNLPEWAQEKLSKAEMMVTGVWDYLLSQKEQGVDPKVTEGMLDNPGQEDSPVAQAITRRIMLQRVDLLSKYGPEKVMNAIDEVADFVGDVDEIGSSDVSGWIRHVEQMLGNMPGNTPGVTTEAYDRLKKVFDFSDFKG